MVMNNKLFKQKLLIIIDMLICLVCALFVSVFFYRLKLIASIKMEIIVLSIILLPLTMALSMIFFKGYTNQIKNTTMDQLNRYIKAIFVCAVLYALQDMIFGYYDMVVCKIVSSLISGFFIIQMRILYIQLSFKKEIKLEGCVKKKRKVVSTSIPNKEMVIRAKDFYNESL